MCGLAGIIATEKTAFNVNHFNILGTLNDERGGDSCGIFIDGQVEYGIDDRSMFRYFTCDVKYPKYASIALLHCRKASPGYPINLQQAQPVIIKNQSNGKIDFVLMHNGTINNIKALATKYIPNTDIFGLSDSQILAQIIYHKGYDVLAEYAGCAVLIIVDYRTQEPTVLMFKGSSCYNEAKSKYERPLFYMYDEGKFYFSSMYTSLYCINYKKTIYDFPINELCQLKNNKLFCIKKVNRLVLKKPETNYSVYNNTYNAGYIHNNLYYDVSTGIYMLNGSVAHGIYNVYPSGYLIDEKYAVKNTTTTNRIPFFHGRLLYNEDCYKFLASIAELFEDDVLPIYCPEVIDYFAYSPRIVNGVLTTVDENFNYVRYINGNYVILFTNGYNITVDQSILTKNYIYPTSALDKYHNTKVFFNFDELEKQIMLVISSKLVNLNAVQ